MCLSDFGQSEGMSLESSWFRSVLLAKSRQLISGIEFDEKSLWYNHV
jgi:hypothetical protein